jgi:hypothetical protein
VKTKDPEVRLEKWLKDNHIEAVHLSSRQEFILKALEAGVRFIEEEQDMPVWFPELAPLRRPERAYVLGKLEQFREDDAGNESN